MVSIRKGIAKLFTIAIIIYAILHYIDVLFPLTTASTLLGLTGIIVFVSGVLLLSMRTITVPLFLFLIAFVIQVMTGHSLVSMIIEGSIEMSNLITLLLIVPAISWIFQEEPYIEAIVQVGKQLFDTSKKFYAGMMLINQIIAYFLLFGCIPMMYQFVNDFLPSKTGEAWEYFKGTALLRSFALTTLWVVSIPSFAFAVDHLGASLGWSILQGFFISMLGIALALFFLVQKEKTYQMNFTAGIQEEMHTRLHNSMKPHEAKRLVTEFVALFVSMFSTILLIHFVVGWRLLAVIPPIIMMWTIGYFLSKKRSKQLVLHTNTYITVHIQQKAQQFSVLLAAGILIYSVTQSGVGEYMIDGLFYLVDVIPFVNFLAIIPFMAIVLGFLGLGPLTVIVLVAGILESVALPFPPELVVLAMTSGSVISVMLSPVVLPVIILSTTNRLSIMKNGIGFNWGFAVIFYFIVQLYLQVVWFIIG